MQKTLAAAALLLGASFAPIAPAAPIAPVAPDFSRTMRVDYVHGGGPSGEFFRIDGISNDGEWPGSRTILLDDTNLGEYQFEVTDAESGERLYSRGFASIYGEWATTPDVRAADRSFHESVRFPWPLRPVRLVIRDRSAQNTFRDVWSTDIDPRTVLTRSARADAGQVGSIVDNGPPRTKVDVLLISEGYSAPQLADFRAQAKALVEALFALEPFRTRRSDFNIRTLEVLTGPLPVDFNIFGIERYALTYANRVLRDRAALAPYEVIEILMNERRYGGGGIFNLQSTVAAWHPAATYVFIHEFAHNFAALADEYVGSVTYETGQPRTVEPWEPNITALVDPATLKWRDLVEPGTPIPTPLAYAGKVGAFEGAGYEARGLYRPEAECIMGSRKPIAFCRVCQRAINRVIDLYTR